MRKILYKKLALFFTLIIFSGFLLLNPPPIQAFTCQAVFKCDGEDATSCPFGDNESIWVTTDAPDGTSVLYGGVVTTDGAQRDVGAIGNITVGSGGFIIGPLSETPFVEGPSSWSIVFSFNGNILQPTCGVNFTLTENSNLCCPQGYSSGADVCPGLGTYMQCCKTNGSTDDIKFKGRCGDTQPGMCCPTGFTDDPTACRSVLWNTGTQCCRTGSRNPLDDQVADKISCNLLNNDGRNVFELCTQIPTTPDSTLRNKCYDCMGSAANQKPGIWTAVGCIKTDPRSIIQQVVSIGLSIGGGVALLMILAAAFLLSTSQGDPKRTSDARELITSAIIGLLFIIFSITILQFIGVNILRLPGFGGS